MTFYSRIWQPAALVVSNMERKGVMLDSQHCTDKAIEYQNRINQKQKELSKLWGKDINWASTKQLSEFLYEEVGLPVPPVKGSNENAIQKVPNGKRSTSRVSIQWLGTNQPKHREGLKALLDFKTITKREQFYRGLPSHLASCFRVHPQLSPGTETGRLNCKNPNLQQIPKRGDGIEVREVFRAPEGKKLLAADFQGLEWRILAHTVASRYDDWSMVQEIQDGVDPHSSTAVGMKLCSGPVETVKERNPDARDAGKGLNYKINYGGSALGLGLSLGVSTKRASQYIKAFYQARRGVGRFHDDIIAYARSRGFVKSLLGRKRYLDFDKYPWKAERQAKNVIQACAVDVVSLAMLKCNPVPEPELVELGWFNEELYELGAELILQVHDELLFEVPNTNVGRAKEVVSVAMSKALEGEMEFLCPLGIDVGVGNTWRDCK